MIANQRNRGITVVDKAILGVGLDEAHANITTETKKKLDFASAKFDQFQVLQAATSKIGVKLGTASETLEQAEQLETPSSKTVDEKAKGGNPSDAIKQATTIFALLVLVLKSLVSRSIQVSILSASSTFTVLKCALKADLITFAHLLDIWLVFGFQLLALLCAVFIAIVSAVKNFIQSWNLLLLLEGQDGREVKSPPGHSINHQPLAAPSDQ